MTELLERLRGPVRPQWLAGALAAPRRLPLAAVLGVLAAATGAVVLALRIVEDVHGKPLFEDEAVAGLVAARPFGELIHTVWWERGGSPLHFLLAHLALWPDGSPYALRWLSVVFAFAAVPVAWDLGRRLAGPVAAGTSALVVASSSLLGVYGSFGRMYSLYAFAALLAVDLFVKAERERTGRSALWAALAAWLLPAIHPYGIFLVAAEGLVAVALWRGRNVRAALPVGLVALAILPFVYADLRLAARFSVGLSGRKEVAGPGDALGQVWRAFEASAGGAGWTLAVALALALAGGAVLLARREVSLLAVFAVSAALPPVLLLLARTSSQPGLSPRHLTYLLPFFAGAVGVAVAWAAARLRTSGAAVALLAAGALLVVSPLGGIRDPRDWLNDVLGGGSPGAAVGSPENVAPAAAWLSRNIEPGAVIFPYSVVYLAALPAARHATALPYAQKETVIRSLDRVHTPVPELIVSIPIGASRLDSVKLERLLGDHFRVERFGPWLLLRGDGPFSDDRSVLVGAYEALAAARRSTLGLKRHELGWYYRTTTWVLCGALRSRFGDRCPPAELTRLQP